MSFIILRIPKRYSLFYKDSQINQFSELNKSFKTNWRSFTNWQGSDILREDTRLTRTRKSASRSSASATEEVLDMKDQTNFENEITSSVKANANLESPYGSRNQGTTFGCQISRSSNTTTHHSRWTSSFLSSQRRLTWSKRNL